MRDLLHKFEEKNSETMTTVVIQKPNNNEFSNSFVGHYKERLQLLEKHKESINGHYRICFITGEAGSGKSWLIEEFCRTSLKDNDNILFAKGNCEALSGVGTPYLPFLQLFRDPQNRLFFLK